MSAEPDDTDDLLTPQPGSPPPALRDELLRRTERVLSRVVWLRRAWKAAAVALVFVLGGAAGWFLKPPVAHAPGSPETVTVVVPVIVPVPPPVADAPGSPQPPLSASQTELKAEQADDRMEAATLYRAAGDAFLRDQDYPNATRCYRLFLLRAGDGGLSPEPDDSWLLTSLKNAAFKEKIDVPKIDG